MSYEGQRRINQGIDWILILLFAVLVLIGWMAIFAATYDESQPDIFDLDKSYGRQFLWITGSTILAGAILITDSKFYATVAYGIYATVVLLLAAVFVIGTSKHGNMNWIEIGSFQLQPSEFAKFATNLALAKFLSGLNVNMKNLRTRFVALGIFGLPAILVLLQGDTGSALVFLSYFLVLFRFGLPGSYLLLGVYVLVLSVLSLLFDKMILILVLFAIAGVLFYIARKNRTVVLIVLTALLLSSGYVLTTDYVFNHVLEKHQQQRVNVLLGKKVDVKDADYNVRQSKIAIGSNGLQR